MDFLSSEFSKTLLAALLSDSSSSDSCVSSSADFSSVNIDKILLVSFLSSARADFVPSSNSYNESESESPEPYIPIFDERTNDAVGCFSILPVNGFETYAEPYLSAPITFT